MVMKSRPQSTLFAILLIWLILILGCSRSKNDSQTSQYPSPSSNSNTNARPNSNTMNINGTQITAEELQKIDEKVLGEKIRRKLSDREALDMTNKEIDKLVAEKQKQKGR